MHKITLYSFDPCLGRKGKPFEKKLERPTCRGWTLGFFRFSGYDLGEKVILPRRPHEDWEVYIGTSYRGKLYALKDEWSCFCMGYYYLGTHGKIEEWFVLPPLTLTQDCV